MPCNPIHDDSGKIVGIACSRGQKKSYCETCGSPSTILCDYPVTRNGKQETCDRKCCKRHSFHVSPEIDHCLPHHRFIESLALELKRIPE